MSKSRSLRAGTIALAAAVLAAAPAEAHVRMRTPDGVPLAWKRGCPSFTIATGGGGGFDADAMAAMIAEARDAWTGGPAGCGQLPIQVVGHDGEGDVEYDGTSLVLWRPAEHCKDPAHDDDEVCLSPNAAAVTTVFYFETGERAGELLEADIEINGALRFAADGDPAASDLRSTLTHELGHALGLEHTCDPIPGRAPMVDSNGALVPTCFPSAALAESVKSATMYPYLAPGDLSGRTPLEDERAAVCAIYGGHSGRCEYTGPGCGCGSAGGAAGAAGFFAAVLLLLHLRSIHHRRSSSCATVRSP